MNDTGSTQDGIFFSNQFPGQYWDTMVKDVCDALTRQGCPTQPINPTRIEDVIPTLRTLSTQSPRFAACFNFRITWTTGLCESMQRIVFPHEFIEAWPIILFLDHPAYENRTTSLFEAYCKDRPHIPAPLYGVMDEDHLAFMADMGVPPERIILFPQGGPPPAPNPSPMTERPIDFLFHGSIGDYESDETFYSRLGITTPEAQEMMGETIRLVLADDIDPYLGAKAVLNRLGHKNINAIAHMAVDIDKRARHLRRWNVLSNLRGLNIHFCGHVSDTFRAQNPNGIYHGPLSFKDVTDLVRHSKIMINESINLRHATLMRLHYAMADGCVVASQKNVGLMESFADTKDIIFLTGTPDDVPKLQSLVSNVSALQTIANQALETHTTAHLWDHRVSPLLDIIRQR